jgi:hypothetical protein
LTEIKIYRISGSHGTGQLKKKIRLKDKKYKSSPYSTSIPVSVSNYYSWKNKLCAVKNNILSKKKSLLNQM